MKRMSYYLFRLIKFLVRTFYPETEFNGTGNLTAGKAVIVGNHAKTNAPIACELYFPGRHRTWTSGEMMHLREVPEYAFNDFWVHKPGYIRWIYRGLSYLIAPLSVCVFSNADCIGVYHDSRIITTFRSSVTALHNEEKVIILPEHDAPYNNIVCEFREKFVDVARMYYRKYREAISFVPMYTAPDLRTVYLGKPVLFDPSAPIAQERTRISKAMMDAITEIARSLPEHTVVPYPNMPKKSYPSNKDVNTSFDSNGLYVPPARN